MAKVQCNNGHFYDDSRYNTCPKCSVDVDLNIVRKSMEKRIQNNAGEYVPGSKPVASHTTDVDNSRTDIKRSQQNETENESSQEKVSAVVNEETNKPHIIEYQGPRYTPEQNDSPATQGYYRINETEPVVGWIVCMNKDMRGKDFRLTEGRNILSKDTKANICLPEMKDGSGGMCIMYASVNDSFFIQTGSSEVFVNGEKVHEAAPLEGQNVIDIDEYNLVFIPFCVKGRNWNE